MVGIQTLEADSRSLGTFIYIWIWVHETQMSIAFHISQFLPEAAEVLFTCVRRLQAPGFLRRTVNKILPGKSQWLSWTAQAEIKFWAYQAFYFDLYWHLYHTDSDVPVHFHAHP